MKKIWVLTLFPQLFAPFKDVGVVGQLLSGQRGSDIQLNIVPLEEFSPKKFKGVDAAPYGGGPGVVLRADVLQKALLEGVVEAGGYGVDWKSELDVIYTHPRGKVWQQSMASSWAHDKSRDLVFICGRYEGIDERFIETYVNKMISLGDFITSGGELPVMVIVDSILRLTKGTLGNEESWQDESFEGEGLLEHPHYTRPSEFEGKKVPEVLLSGNHQKIKEYRAKERLRITKKYRNDLLKD